MTTRPDLDAARGLLYRVAQHPAYLDIPRELVEELASESALLLTYCRELEEENKRLEEMIPDPQVTDSTS